LVEAFEAAFALEVFEVAADGALGKELLVLGVGDETGANRKPVFSPCLSSLLSE